MEEFIGQLWDRFITRAARTDYPEAAVRLPEMDKLLGVFFRALGGDPGLRVAAATEARHGARRSLLARIAGSGEKHAPARLDASTLRLPPIIAVFPERALNRELYLWLAALAASSDHESEGDDPTNELQRNQHATRRALATWPGLRSRYERLLAAHLAQRPDPAKLPPAERAQELAIRAALSDPDSTVAYPEAPANTPPPQPPVLWLSQPLPVAASQKRSSNGQHEAGPTPTNDAEKQAHRAERVESVQEKNGILLHFRAESLLTLGEYVKVNRSRDDDPDSDAARAARDLDHLSLAQDEDHERVASRVRFDLDLPSAAEDDVVLGDGLPLPEWDYRKQQLLPDHVRLLEMLPRHASPAPLPEALRRTARRLHQQFAALLPSRRWQKAQQDGSELDLDAFVRATTDRACGSTPDDNLYLSLQQTERNLACLVLADLSLSTDAWVNNEARVIDVVRDALLLFGEALSATGDRFALAGFSSLRRSQVRYTRLKNFRQPFNDAARGRVLALKPGYYTRLGAAIRHASAELAREPAERRVLLILSDGKPNDLDLYEGRYGIEDTRMAVLDARRQGLLPFCVTIDREGESYLPHLFGPGGYTVIRRPEELPSKLPQLYAQLTR